MKKIGLVMIMIVLMATVANAAGINGDYKGKPIVKIISNSIELKAEDAPAVIMDSRAMVPISMLKQLGAEITWNQENYSVDVKMPEYKSTNDEDIETIKLYSHVQYIYGMLDQLGEMLTDLSVSYRLAYDGIALNDFESLTNSKENLNFLINSLNTMNDAIVTPTSELWYRGIFDNALLEIMETYSKSVDYYIEADKYINSYNKSRSNSDFIDYEFNLSKGYEVALGAKSTSKDKVFEYYDLLQNY